jgi:hypothetical protein
MHEGEVLKLNVYAWYPGAITLNIGLYVTFDKIPGVALQPQRWRRYVLPYGSAVSILHGVITRR